jgi:hypothetical protein
MSQAHRSHSLTSSYRQRKLALARRVSIRARELWPTIEELDGTRWPEQMAAIVTRAQTQGIRLAAGYLTAYTRSETGTGRAIAIDPAPYAGKARDGRPVIDLMASAIIGTRAALKRKRPVPDALRLGLARGVRSAEFEVMQAPRDALIATVHADERFSDFQRSVAGTCAACMDLSGNGGPRFEVHPGCECEPEPVIAGTKDRFPLPTGFAVFMGKTKTEQDDAIGPDAADLVRSGQANLGDFVSHTRLDKPPHDFITQRPVQDVQ